MNGNCSNTPHSDACSQSPPILEDAAAEHRPLSDLTPEQLNFIVTNLPAILAANGQKMDDESIKNPSVNVKAQEKRRKQREKVYANGFIMSFDGISKCDKKHFWRCEFKNFCNARMHTDAQRKKIITNIQSHNHPKITGEELQLYGLDPAKLEEDTLYSVENRVPHNQRRRIRKKVADEEATRKWLNEIQSRLTGKSDDKISGLQPLTSSSSSSAAAAAVFPTADFNFNLDQLLAATTADITTGTASIFNDRLLLQLASVSSPQPVVADAQTLDIAKKLCAAWQGATSGLQPSTSSSSSSSSAAAAMLPTADFNFTVEQLLAAAAGISSMLSNGLLPEL